MFHRFVVLNYRPTDVTTTQLIRFVSSDPDFTVEYLRNSCGLSAASAFRASKNILLNKSTIARPDSVLSLFKTHGFTQSHISKIISSNPRLLLSSTEKTLKPKLEYFNNIGISGPYLGKLLCKDTSILLSSLESRIIPSINFVRSFVPTDTGIATVLYRFRYFSSIEHRMRPHIEILRNNGVPETSISKLMMTNPRPLRAGLERLNDVVLQLKNMGFSPSSKVFVSGLNVLVRMKKPKWDAKLEAYMSFGWSRDDVLSMFKKQPFVMAISVENITSTLDFFKNTLNWTLDDLSKNLPAIILSLEKRVIPRCYVLRTLLLKGLITKNCIGHALRVAEDVFLTKYVIKFRDEEPRLFEEYQSKLGTQGSKPSSKDGSKIKEL